MQARKALLLPALAIASLGVLHASDLPAPPLLDEVVAQNVLSAEVEDPRLAIYGPPHEDMDKAQRELWDTAVLDFATWASGYNAVLASLVAGKVAAFHEKLLAFEESVIVNPKPGFLTRTRAGSAESIALLYSWAIEADVEGIDANRFAALIKLMDPEQDTSQRRFIAASYAYMTKDEAKLVEISNGEGFVAGYASLLLARINMTSANLARAIELFEREWRQVEHATGQECGLVAMHLAEAYRYRYVGTRDSADLERAVEFARLARTNLESLDTPLFSAEAHHQTAEILQVLYEVHNPEDAIGRARLAARLDRARELSIP